MSASLLDELLGDDFAQTPAKAANPASRQQLRGSVGDSAPCEGLRISANGEPATASPAPDSHTFAAVRRPVNTPINAERRGVSQVSQVSQWVPAQGEAQGSIDLPSAAWTEEDRARFIDRRSRLLRWGWAESEAEALADRLRLRDMHADYRHSCAECQHYRPGRCGNHRLAGLEGPEVGRDLAALLQHCAGFTQREGAK
jgi:hypothetical protein